MATGKMNPLSTIRDRNGLFKESGEGTLKILFETHPPGAKSIEKTVTLHKLRGDERGLPEQIGADWDRTG